MENNLTCPADAVYRIYADRDLFYSRENCYTLEQQRGAERFCGKVDFVGASASGIFIIVYPYKSFEKTSGQQSFKRRDVMRAFFRSGHDLDGNRNNNGDISFLSF